MLRTLLRVLGAYWLYEKWLYGQVKKKPLPRHVALILDGNRRWARRRGWPPWVGHRVGADKVEEVLNYIYELGIETVTLYVLSTENLKRPTEEVKELLNIIKERADELRRNPRIHRNQVKVRVIGRIHLLPRDVRRSLKMLEEATANYSKHFLNIAVAYGGRAEIVDAVRMIAEKTKQGLLSVHSIDEKTIEQHLYTHGLPQPDPELIIRTSGEERISNFFLWQSAYSEFVFQDVYWPDFRKIDLLRAIRTFQQRERRIGI